MQTEKDYEEFVALLNRHDVDYMIVGAFALAVHGHPRFTGDLDIFLSTDSATAGKIVMVLDEFGFGSLNVTPSDFRSPDAVIQLGYRPCRIDLMTSISGVSFEAAYRDRLQAAFGPHQAWFIGLDHLIENKEATWRNQDLADERI